MGKEDAGNFVGDPGDDAKGGSQGAVTVWGHPMEGNASDGLELYPGGRQAEKSQGLLKGTPTNLPVGEVGVGSARRGKAERPGAQGCLVHLSSAGSSPEPQLLPGGLRVAKNHPLNPATLWILYKNSPPFPFQVPSMVPYLAHLQVPVFSFLARATLVLTLRAHDLPQDDAIAQLSLKPPLKGVSSHSLPWDWLSFTLSS